MSLYAALWSPAFAQPPTFEEFIRPPQFRTAALSPSGRYIAGIRREGDLDLLVVIDWRESRTRLTSLE